MTRDRTNHITSTFLFKGHLSGRTNSTRGKRRKIPPTTKRITRLQGMNLITSIEDHKIFFDTETLQNIGSSAACLADPHLGIVGDRFRHKTHHPPPSHAREVESQTRGQLVIAFIPTYMFNFATLVKPVQSQACDHCQTNMISQ